MPPRNEVLNRIPYVDYASGKGSEDPTFTAYWSLKYLPNNDPLPQPPCQDRRILADQSECREFPQIPKSNPSFKSPYGPKEGME